MKKLAFTLAEVLITLGIIGVVAAMTLPTLITNARAKQYSAGFKKTLSTLSNAAQLSSSMYDFDFSGLSSYCSSTPGKDNQNSIRSVCALLNGTLTGVTVYRGIDSLGTYEINSPTFNGRYSMVGRKGDIPIYELADGTLILFSSVAGGYGCTKEIGKSATIINDGKNGNGCYGIIDVNGRRPPNKEVKCTKGTNLGDVDNSGNCIVSSSDVGDIFAFAFYDGIAVPNSSASWYVLKNSK